jgi:hypothetical protein
MKFKQATDDPNNGLSYRLVSENDLVEIGAYKVMFGWRVRAGFCGSSVCELDWCGGAEWKDVERLYSLCVAILSKKEENSFCFDGVPPYSNKKPFFKDKAFIEICSNLAGDFSLLSLSRD